MTVIRSWLRLDVRRRWRSLAVLALLVGLSTATVLAAFAGARRQASAEQRLDERTLPATAAILANTPGFPWQRVAALPYVMEFATFGPSFPINGLPADAEADIVVGDSVMNTVERPVILAGRAINPARVDEAMMTRSFADRFHRHVGDRVTVMLPTAAELEAQQGSGPNGELTGPPLRVRIVGIEVSPWFRAQPGQPGGLTLSPAVPVRYPLNTVGKIDGAFVSGVVNAMVRLRGGEGQLTRLREDLDRVSNRSDVEVISLAEQFGRPLQRQASFEARCVLAFGIAALLASLFLVGQAVARFVAAEASELGTLRALGMTPREAMLAACGGPAVAALIGTAVGVAGAIVASRWFPFGSALLVEPDPGTSADWFVLGVGAVVAVTLVCGGALVAARIALNRAGHNVPVRRSAIASLAGRAGLPAPILIGSRFALEAGPGGSGVPVRPALLGAVGGVLGVVAAATFSHAVTDAADHPQRFGQTHSAYAFVGFNGQDFVPARRLAGALAELPQVTGVDDARVAVATGADGSSSVTLYSYSGGAKPLDVVITSGRLPVSSDEVLLAKRSLAALHTAVGRAVELTTPEGVRQMKVVGSGMVPNGAHNSYSDGGWVTDNGYDAMFTGSKFHLVYVATRTRHDADPAALSAAVAKIDPRLDGVEFSPPDALTELYELRQVRLLPVLLGAFLAVLAVAAVGHALATAVRRRAHDLAVLRTLGMTQRQCRAVVVTQASLLAIIGVAFGVPLGLALGRSVWRAVADYTPLYYVAPTAAVALLLVVPGALVLTNLLAAWPAQHAARLRVAAVLRTE